MGQTYFHKFTRQMQWDPPTDAATKVPKQVRALQPSPTTPSRSIRPQLVKHLDSRRPAHHTITRARQDSFKAVKQKLKALDPVTPLQAGYRFSDKENVDKNKEYNSEEIKRLREKEQMSKTLAKYDEADKISKLEETIEYHKTQSAEHQKLLHIKVQQLQDEKANKWSLRR